MNTSAENNSTPDTWQALIEREYAKGYLKDILKRVRAEIQGGAVIFPQPNQIFNCFSLTPLDKVRVVIVGQDPYFNPGQAHGLAFSVPPGKPIPPSLANIYQEIRTDTGEITKNPDGCLIPWAEQGVLLINMCLTVESGHPMSHSSWGWERFTAVSLKLVAEVCPTAVFLLWGKRARAVKAILPAKCITMEAAHPSPQSCYSGYFGCKHFSKTNSILQMLKTPPIEW